MIMTNRLLRRLPKPKVVPFKEGSHLTCPHGRYWASCNRCRLPPDATPHSVALRGESCHWPRWRAPNEI